MQNTNGLCCLCQNSKYKWLLQGKGVTTISNTLRILQATCEYVTNGNNLEEKL